MDQWKGLLSACILTVGLLKLAESLSIDANSLVFSDDLGSEFLPCRSWIQVCEEGEPTPRCTTHEEYAQFQQQQLVVAQAVFPGKCAMVNGRCSFSQTQPSCVQSCRYFGHECTTIDHFFADPVTPRQSCPPEFPSSSDVCIPEDGGCAFRNPCVLFQGHCGGEYMCGSLADYALFLTSALPPCAPPPPDPLSLNPRVPRVPRPPPPGECLYQDGQCKWSECRTWLSACGISWNCGTAYEYELSRYYPRPRCAYDPTALAPVDPGRCEYNVELGECAFSEVCDGGKVFQECGSPCPQTCDGMNIPAGHFSCPSVCLRGCFCPPGTLLHRDQCIPPHMCPPTLTPAKRNA
jgi:hypothetical protein